jgi:copper chaperone CopZ
MKFSSAKQIIPIVLVWAGALYAIDEIKNPRPLSELFAPKKQHLTVEQNVKEPTLYIYLNHMCCSGCLDDLNEALAKLDYLGKPMVATTPPSQTETDKIQVSDDKPVNYGNRIDVKVTDIKRLDFVQLNHALESVGFYAERIDFGGVAHFRLAVDLPHLCCNLCVNAGEQLPKVGKTIVGGGFTWLDSVEMKKGDKKMIVHVKYNQRFDVGELFTALHRMGFAPSAVRVDISSEK